MLLTNLKRIVRLGLTNFIRNGLVSFASVLSLTVALFVVGGLLLASAFLNGSLEEIKNKVDIAVSFNINASVENIEQMKTAVGKQPGVQEVTLISREDELEAFRTRHQDNQTIMQSLEEVGNPFGARLNIRALDPTYYEKITAFLKAEDEKMGEQKIINHISFKKEVVDRLINLMAVTRKVGLVASAILFCLSLLATFNTISLAIYISRDEVSVMRLMGANNTYVKGPFIVEGAIAGLIASLVAMLLLYPSAWWLKEMTGSAFGGVNVVNYYIYNFGKIFLTILSAGVGIGVFASYLAVRKHAEV